MELKYHLKDNCPIFTFDFDLDLYNAKEMRDEFLKLLEENQWNRVILNLDTVRYLDSSGAGALVYIRQRTSGKVDIRFCNVNENVLNVLKLSHLHRLFQIDDNEEVSLEKIRP
jgi:anti-sigma B factor antagonist